MIILNQETLIRLLKAVHYTCWFDYAPDELDDCFDLVVTELESTRAGQNLLKEWAADCREVSKDPNGQNDYFTWSEEDSKLTVKLGDRVIEISDKKKS